MITASGVTRGGPGRAAPAHRPFLPAHRRKLGSKVKNLSLFRLPIHTMRLPCFEFDHRCSITSSFFPLLSRQIEKRGVERSEELFILSLSTMRKGSKGNYQLTVNLLMMIQLVVILNHEPVNWNDF